MINVYHTSYIRTHLWTRHAEQLTPSQPSAKKRRLRPYTLPYPTLPYPTLPFPTLPYPALPYPTLPYPTMTRPKSYSVWGQITQKGLGREAQWKGKQRESSSSFPSTFSSLLWRRVDLDSYANCAHLFVHEAFCCCSTFNSATELSTLPILVCRMLFTNEPDNLIYCTV